MTNIFATHAPALVEAGFSVIPASGKRPLIKGWTEFCSRLPTPEEIKAWCKQYPNCNIALCMGAASGLIALDFDNDVSGEHSEIIAQIPDSPVKKQGAKGFTAFYRYNGEKSRSFSINGTCSLDILSTGKASVVPPSIHPSGKPYVWLGTDLLTIKREELPCLTI